MIIFIPKENKWRVARTENDKIVEFYPKNLEPVSRTKCLLFITYGRGRTWLPKGKFKIEEV